MFIIAGLGNPETKYLKTLHNLGFMAVDTLADNLGVAFDKKGFNSVYAEVVINGVKTIILKPQTYMNLSGNAIREVMAFYKIPIENLFVIYDDFDIPNGTLRIRSKGSAGTHNGMRDIVAKLGSTEFARIRIGTKPDQAIGDVINFVLSNIKKEDEGLFKTAICKAADAAKDFACGKPLENIMREYNG